MMITEYISNLLFEHDCVVVPGLGGFLTRYISADIHPISHKFTPPSKQLAFNEQLQLNDGLLVTAIAAEEKISNEEALAKVEEFVYHFREKIKNFGSAEWEGLGRFFLNNDNKLEFEPDTKANFLNNAFGLPELYFKPIERNLDTMNKLPNKTIRPAVKNQSATRKDEVQLDANGNPIPKKKSKALLITLITIPIVLLLLAGGVVFAYVQKGGDINNISMSSIMDMFKGEEKAPVVEKPAEEPKVEETIPEKVLRYYVVVGSFKDEVNASHMKNKLEKKGVSASVVEEPTQQLYRVSIAEFDSKEDAFKKRTELMTKYGEDIWVMGQ